jgi:hypothetical protein
MASLKRMMPLAAGILAMHLGASAAGVLIGSSAASANDFCPADSTGQEQRTLRFENQCDFPVWVGFVGGSIPCKTDGSLTCPSSTSACQLNPGSETDGTCTCQTDADCGSAQACNPIAKFCYWTLPPPTDAAGKQSFKLDAADSAGPKSAKSCIPQQSQLVQLSGALFGRTGCVTNAAGILVCQTGTCQTTQDGEACLPGEGGTPPATLAEFTFQNSFAGTSNKDFYDITIINGANVAMEMSPIQDTFTIDANDPYSCQSPGRQDASSTGLTGCSWEFAPGTINGSDQTSLLRLVSPKQVARADECPAGTTFNAQTGVCLCSADTQCSKAGDLLCGLATGAVVGPPGGLGQVCGKTIGEWSADQICGLDPMFQSPDKSLNCAQEFDFNSKPGTTTLQALLLCPQGGAESCYNRTPTPTTDCCGCATDPANQPYFDDWPKVLAVGDMCLNNNPTWGQNVQNWLAFMKRACPTSYTYPFDDATSTFTCLSNKMHGGVGYQVTYCPGGTALRAPKSSRR